MQPEATLGNPRELEATWGERGATRDNENDRSAQKQRIESHFSLFLSPFCYQKRSFPRYNPSR